MIILITSHAYTHHCISLSLTCWFSDLYILSIVFKHGVYIYHFFYLFIMVCVDISDIPVLCLTVWCMTTLLLCDCMFACSCGQHIYPLISNSLGFGHSFHPGSHYCKCETFCVLALWPSQRLGVGSSDGLYRCTGAFWRRTTLWCRLESDYWRLV